MSSNYFSLHAESAKRAAGYFFKQPIASLLILAMLSIAMTLRSRCIWACKAAKTC